jgi:hypothetical protein
VSRITRQPTAKDRINRGGLSRVRRSGTIRKEDSEIPICTLLGVHASFES